MIALPRTAAQAAALLAAHPDAVVRAGGTDLADLRHRGLRRGPTVDLRDAGLAELSVGEGLRIGARVPLATLASDPRVRAAYPGLAAAAGGLATPQIRAVATLAGSLLQDVRCWYYRDPASACLKKGGSRCLAREGDALQHACWDLGACIAPHPSTMAVALLALDAAVEVEGAPSRTMAAFLGEGTDPRRTHALPADAVVTAIVVPPPAIGARSAYRRTIQRARAEWPLVEAFVQVEVEAGMLVRPRVAVGGVANRPLRLPEVEAALVGLPVDADPTAALRACDARARGGPAATAWRARLVVPTLADTLADALAAAPATALAAPSADAAPVRIPAGGPR
ncbi:MAG: FAD binding domain-containing protein [Myxococcota bacterium]